MCVQLHEDVTSSKQNNKVEKVTHTHIRVCGSTIVIVMDRKIRVNVRCVCVCVSV